jgi:cell division protein FtsI (penicillin-binding protein 3)
MLPEHFNGGPKGVMKNRKNKIAERKLWDEDFEKIRLEQSKKRAIIIRTIMYFCFFSIFIRLVFLMVFDHGVLSEKAARQYRKTKTLTVQRGGIWDREMRPLAVNTEAESLYAVPSRITDVRSIAQQLSPVIKVSAMKLNKKFYMKKNKSFIWLARRMDEKTAQRVYALQTEANLQEIGMLTESKRYYPNGHVASHILGFTNIDNEGIDGIELKYNDYIKGKKRKVYLKKDARGMSLSEGFEEDMRGDNLLLTVDETLQNIIEREIAKAVQTWKAKAAVAIMMNPDTGEILAMANRPTYNPNLFHKSKVKDRRNRTITDIYEPGSTFKMVLASAALEEGVVRPHQWFDVSKGFIKVPGGLIRDDHKNKILSFSEVIQKSSNTGAVQIGQRLGEKKFYRYIKAFGFGEKTGIDLPGEVRGILREPGDWSGRSLASLSIGQEVAVTPLQILRAYSVIANGGKLMKPYLVSEIISSEGETIKRFYPEIERKVISEETARRMRDILKTVVEEGGTAESASILGNIVAGKTGTAQMINPKTGRYSKDDFVSSFVGFVPADNPEIALIVVVYKPKGKRYGGVVAAPVFKSIVEQTLVYLNIPMERGKNHIILVSQEN